MASNIGGTTMTKISETVGAGSGSGGQIIYEGPADAANPSPPSTLGGAPISQTQTTVRGGKKTFVVTYQAINLSASGVTPTKTVLRSSDGSANERPIEEHPNYREGGSSPSDPEEWKGQPVINDNLKRGVQAFLVPGIIYRRTEFKPNFTFTESELVGNVGKRNSPVGVSGLTSGRWLKTGIDVQENSDGSAVVTSTWLYNPDGWDTDIYP